MRSFVLNSAEYDRARRLLLRDVQGFADSKEYESLVDYDLSDVTGLVCAKFTRFFLRFQEEEIRHGLSDRDARTLEDAYRVIEELSSSPDLSVQNLIQTEVFENMTVSGDVITAAMGRFGVKTRDLYEDWRRRQPGGRGLVVS
jgi:hypothetical protein